MTASHNLITTGGGWRCLRCGTNWDTGEDTDSPCEAGDDYGFVTDAAFEAGVRPKVSRAPHISAEEHKAFWERQLERVSPKVDTMAVQVGGAHYKTLAIQPTEFCQRNGLDFCIGSVLKYLTRWRSKNGIEDLRKAKHFVEIREAFPYHIRQPGRVEITMLEYVTRNGIRPDDAEALYRLEAYYNYGLAIGRGRGTARLISEIDRLISRAA